MTVVLSRISLVVVIVLAFAAGGNCASAGNTRGHGSHMVKEADFVPHPPETREYLSPAGAYVFSVKTPNDWATPAVVGELAGRAGTPPSPIWSGVLPQDYGPRFVVVADSAAVLMLDEWNNVKSRHAVLLFDRGGKIIARHDFDAVHKAMGVEIAQFTKHARHGWWISGPPRVIEGGLAAAVPAAGKVLTIQFATGALSVEEVAQ